MPVHENPANRHTRTTRTPNSIWAIVGTHPANRHTRTTRSVHISHSGLPHMDSPTNRHTRTTRFSKNTCRTATQGRPQFKTIHLKTLCFLIHIHNSCQFKSMHPKFPINAILHKNNRVFDILNMQFIYQIGKKDYLP